ncbi:MAG: hypothetical protein V3R85_02790 [Alphaproteobacteria bacterium]
MARLRHDVVARLLATGRLLPSDADAVEEIRTVHEAVGRGMFPTAQPVSTTGRRPRGALATDFLDRMSEHERFMWQRHYLPWTRALELEIAAGLKGTRWLQLVIDIVVDNATPREVEARYRLRHGRGIEYLRRGLEIYLRA